MIRTLFGLGLLVAALAGQAQTPLALRNASASTEASAARVAYKAIDGDAATRWEASNSSPGSWFAVDFALEMEIEQVRVQEHGQRVRAWEVQIRQQGVWQTVASGSEPTGGMPAQINLANKPVTSALRVFFPARNSGQPSISEIVVMGRAAGGCMYYDGSPESIIKGVADCGGRTLSLGQCSSGLPLFRLADGAHLKNVNIVAGGWVICAGSCTLEGVHWRSVQCPQAVRVEPVPAGPATLTLVGGSITQPPLAAPITPFWFRGSHATLVLKNFRFSGPIAGLNSAPPSLISPPDPLRPVPYSNTYLVENVRFDSGLTGPLLHVFSSGRATIRDLTINGYTPGAPVICKEYYQNMDYIVARGEGWNTPLCDVSPSDVRAF